MSGGLKIWLAIWSIITGLLFLIILYTGFDTRFVLFQTIQDLRNLILFPLICSILFGSILFQILQVLFENKLIMIGIAIVTYFIVLITALPYSIYACLLLGILAAPAGLFHYKLSVSFFGEIEDTQI